MRRAGQAARLAVYLSMPIVHYPQDEIEGNPFEVHVEEDWDPASVTATFEGIGAVFTGTEVGVFERLVGVPASGPGSGGLDRLAAGDPQ